MTKATARPPADDNDACSPAVSSSRWQCELDTANGKEIGAANDNNISRHALDHDHGDSDDVDRLPRTATSTPTTIIAGDDDLPLEYQRHEIDPSNNDSLDPFELIFRKYVPIPRVYFWETASPTNDYHKQLPFKIKLWHRSIYYLGEMLHKAEAGGEVIANLLGLNDGPFEYVTQNITEEEMARSRNILEDRNDSRAAERRSEGDV